jgi:opacity protein-like surface antigen
MPVRPAKFLLLAAAFLLTALFIPAPVSAVQENGPYLAVHLGPSFFKDVPTFDSKIQLNAGGAFGYRFGPIRAEGELAYHHNDIEDFEEPSSAAAGQALADGEVSAWSLMGNVYYDFRNRSPVTPFIGAGAGAVEISRDAALIGGQLLPERKKTLFAYQLMVGSAFALTETMSLNLSYQYFSAPESEILGQRADYNSHNIMIGVKFSF